MAFIGWVACHEAIPLIRNDVTDWELIEDRAAARAVPLEWLRRPTATVIVVGEAKPPLRPAVSLPARKPALVVGR